MSVTEVENIADEILREGLDDWVPLDTLIWSAREVAVKSECDFKTMTIDVLNFLLSEGFALVGDISDSGFTSWTTPPAETIERIVVACEAMGWQPAGGLCWISTTPKGDQRVQDADS